LKPGRKCCTTSFRWRRGANRVFPPPNLDGVSWRNR
jgi:hypothetical protein